MPLNPPKEVRFPDDQRLVEIAQAKPIGWWQDHSNRETCCQTGTPGCDLGEALSRLHAVELAHRRS